MGNDDNLVRDPRSAAEYAGDMSDLRVETPDSGHLVTMEKAAKFNRLVEEFLGGRPELREVR